LKFSRHWAMPSADTFDVKPIGEFVKKYLHGVSVDPFARNSGLATYTNDLSKETSSQYHMLADDFLNMLAGQNVKADVVIFDPPYSPGQIVECYQSCGLEVGIKSGQNGALYKSARTAIRKLCKNGTIVLSFGWNSCGMGDGFTIKEIMLVAHGGAHNDTICLAEKMTQEQIGLDI